MNRPKYKKMYLEEKYKKITYANFIKSLFTALEEIKIANYTIKPSQFDFGYILTLEILKNDKPFFASLSLEENIFNGIDNDIDDETEEEIEYE